MACVIPLLPGLARTGFPTDEGHLLAYPDLMRVGAVPNVDFESTYGPANLWVLSLAFRLLGAGVGVERALGLGYRLLIVAGVHAFAVAVGGEVTRPRGRRLSRRGIAGVAALT